MSDSQAFDRCAVRTPEGDDASGYVPIDCEFHDRLESACVLRQNVRLRIRTESGESVVEGRILDVYVEGAEEFLRFEGIGPVRLDRVALDDSSPDPE